MGPISPQVNFLANGLVFRGKVNTHLQNLSIIGILNLNRLEGMGTEVFAIAGVSH